MQKGLTNPRVMAIIVCICCILVHIYARKCEYMKKIYIDGQAGTTGLRIRERLAERTDVTVLTLPEEKERRIEALSVDCLWHVPFTAEISRISAEAFFSDLLIGRLHAIHLICGFNYSFGARAEGNAALLTRLCRERGIGLTVLPPVATGELQVSSSTIRAAITEGRAEDAALALGRPYSLRARVIDGQKLARTLGFPTINQIFPASKAIPRRGVYAVRIRIDGYASPFYGISNVGIRPTVGGELLCVETHLFDFEGDLYGKEPEVEFLSFLRDEVPFDSIDALSAQVWRDIATARSITERIENGC